MVARILFDCGGTDPGEQSITAELCIHPKQVAIVHAALAPSDAALEWARRVVDADADAAGAAVQLDGRMIDVPVVPQARRTLARAAG